MKHTPEPWRVDQRDKSWVICDENHSLTMISDDIFGAIDEANAARIVACVNACAGISNEQLEDVGNICRLVTEALQAEAQRDELLEALKMAAAVMTACDAPEVSQKTVRELIAKMKGINP